MNKNKPNRKNRQNPIFLKTPKGYTLSILIILTLIAGFNGESRHGFVNIIASVITAVAVDVVFALIENHKRIFPDGAIITGLIIAVILSSMGSWYLSAFIAAISILSKHLIKIRKKPIFNPATFGLLVAIFIFHSGQSWWGALSLLPYWTIIFVILGGFFVAHKVNKLPQVFMFLGVYFGLFLILAIFHVGDVYDALRVPFINTALFFAFFMLTDPPTSPSKEKDQIIFGSITAIIGVTIYAIYGGLTYLLIGLVFANAWKAYKSLKRDQLTNTKNRVNMRARSQSY